MKIRPDERVAQVIAAAQNLDQPDQGFAGHRTVLLEFLDQMVSQSRCVSHVGDGQLISSAHYREAPPKSPGVGESERRLAGVAGPMAEGAMLEIVVHAPIPAIATAP